MEIKSINSIPTYSFNTQNALNRINNGEKIVESPIKSARFNDSSMASKAVANYFHGSQLVNPSFKGHQCSTGDFKVKKQEDIPCACCGRKMLTNEKLQKFVDEASEAKGQDLANVLNDNMEYFRGTEKALAGFFATSAVRNPKMDMAQILTSFKPNPERLMKLEQENVLTELAEKTSKTFGEESPLNVLVKKNLDLVSDSKKAPIERQDFMNNFINLLKDSKCTDKEAVSEILNSAVKLPLSLGTISSIINNYSKSGRTSKDIAVRLATPANVTSEHVKPSAAGGSYDTSNYIAECGECNQARGDMSYDDWFKKFPSMYFNVQKHMDVVTERIIQGAMGDHYDDYPVDIQKAIDNETKGVIKLKVKNPDEIDKAREERGIPKPEKTEKQKYVVFKEGSRLKLIHPEDVEEYLAKKEQKEQKRKK